MKRKIKRGFRFSMSEEMFSEIICKALGMEPGSLDVRHVTSDHYYRGVTISAITEDERFPELTESAEFPLIIPMVKSVKVSDNPERYELQFDGFREIHGQYNHTNDLK